MPQPFGVDIVADLELMIKCHLEHTINHLRRDLLPESHDLLPSTFDFLSVDGNEMLAREGIETVVYHGFASGGSGSGIQ